MKKQLVLGIMSGTSIDSVDYALCEMDERNVRLVDLWNAYFPKKMQEQLHAAARGDLKSWEFSQLHHDLGRFYAEHASRGKRKPTLAGLHGQTVFHNPSRNNPATVQLGEPVYLAMKLGVTVVNNFRVADMALGGQGAPLATIFHQFVFGERGKHVCINNLGGISNVTSLNWSRGTKPAVLSFDTGPANVLMDMAMRHFSGGKKSYDKKGAWAGAGTADEKLLQDWLRHPYFKQAPPKSTGRELFGEPFFKRILGQLQKRTKEDALATLTEFTARSLVLNYQLHLPSAPDRVVLGGGGAANPILVTGIAKALRATFAKKEIELKTSEELGWPVQAIEPAAFAFLAWLRMNRRPGNLPATTGASRPVLCGQITDP
jgi:anhydro-N-acetylmuramic acid kinase